VVALPPDDERFRNGGKPAVAGQPELPLPVLPGRESLVGESRRVDGVGAHGKAGERADERPVEQRVERVALDAGQMRSDPLAGAVQDPDADRHQPDPGAALAERVDVPRDDVRLPPVVVVEEGDDVAPGGPDAGVARGVRPPVLRVADAGDALYPLGSDRLDDGAGRVGRAVVDHDQFEAVVRLSGDGADRVGQERRPVVRRQNHADERPLGVGHTHLTLPDGGGVFR